MQLQDQSAGSIRYKSLGGRLFTCNWSRVISAAFQATSDSYYASVSYLSTSLVHRNSRVIGGKRHVPGFKRNYDRSETAA